MKQAHWESKLLEEKCFKPGRHIENSDQMQRFKRAWAMPDVVEGRRDAAMQLYVAHDTGSVTSHFY